MASAVAVVGGRSLSPRSRRAAARSWPRSAATAARSRSWPSSARRGSASAALSALASVACFSSSMASCTSLSQCPCSASVTLSRMSCLVLRPTAECSVCSVCAVAGGCLSSRCGIATARWLQSWIVSGVVAWAAASSACSIGRRRAAAYRRSSPLGIHCSVGHRRTTGRRLSAASRASWSEGIWDWAVEGVAAGGAVAVSGGVGWGRRGPRGRELVPCSPQVSQRAVPQGVHLQTVLRLPPALAQKVRSQSFPVHLVSRRAAFILLFQMGPWHVGQDALRGFGGQPVSALPEAAPGSSRGDIAGSCSGAVTEAVRGAAVAPAWMQL